MKIRRGVVSIALLYALLAHRAHAESAIILLVTDAQSQGVMRRIQAELEAAGFVVVLRPSDGRSVDRRLLLDEARRESAVAALRVKPEATGAELWVVDRVTGKTVLRDVSLGGDDAVLATKMTELLRASLLEVKAANFQPTEVAAPAKLDAYVAVEAPEPPARGFIDGGGSIVGAGGVGTLGLMTLGTQIPLTRQFAAGLRIGIPVTHTTLSGAEGTSQQSFAYARSELDYLLLGRESGWSPALGVALGVSRLHVSGSATVPFTSENDSVVSVLASGRAGMRIRVSPRLALHGECAALAAAPRPSVIFAGREVARLGFPSWEASLRLHLTAW